MKILCELLNPSDPLTTPLLHLFRCQTNRAMTAKVVFNAEIHWSHYSTYVELSAVTPGRLELFYHYYFHIAASDAKLRATCTWQGFEDAGQEAANSNSSLGKWACWILEGRWTWTTAFLAYKKSKRRGPFLHWAQDLLKKLQVAPDVGKVQGWWRTNEESLERGCGHKGGCWHFSSGL